MLKFTLTDLAKALSGNVIVPQGLDLDPDIATVSGAVDTDSREIVEGGIFVAKPGEVTDGHLFAPAAIANGASVIIVDHEIESSVPQIVVADTVVSLGELAKEVVRRVKEAGDLTIIGITGSNGKTTTKNLVAAICESHGETVAAKASFNNEVGAPLTMLRLTESTKYLVAEMGASGPGEIERLVRLAKPDIGVVLTVGLAHAGEFGGIETTWKTKTEMVKDLTPSDTAVLNIDDFRVAAMADATAANVVWFGRGDEAQIRATEVETSLAGTSFLLHTPGNQPVRVQFAVIGEHHVMNALAATTVGLQLGFSVADIVAALGTVQRAERWRMEVLGGKRVTVINDAYNASPDSMAAGLRTLAQVAPGRSVAVIGAMSELGEYSAEEHDRIGTQIVRLGVHKLVVVGEGARQVFLAATREGSWDGEAVYADDADSAFELLAAELLDGDTVLVKSSNSAGLRFLGDKLGEYFS